MNQPAPLAAALAHHRAGRLPEAERLYRRILEQDPRQPDALHLLGVIAHQAGNAAAAVELISAAIVANPRVADFHSNLGLALEQLGQNEAATASYRRAIALRPDLPEAHNNLGNTLRRLGQRDAAREAYAEATRLRPEYAAAHHNLAVVRHESGELAAALAACETALRLDPGLAQAYDTLGNIRRARGEIDAAITAYQRALALQPEAADVHAHLGAAWHDQRQFAPALDAFDRALALRPGAAATHVNRANTLLALGRLDEALAACRKSLQLRADLPLAYHVLGAIENQRGNWPEAATAFERALAFDPHLAEAHNNLAVVLKQLGRLPEAIEGFRAAVRLQPNYLEAHSGLLFGVMSDPRSSPAAVLREHRAWEAQHAAALPRVTRPTRDRDPERRLRIGYVSSDFNDHAVGRNIHPLLAHHDHGRHEIFAYASSTLVDDLTARLRRHVDEWRTVAHCSDADLAELIARDGIDLLVDLNVHTNGSRLLAFARKPAPVQVTFAGYPGTTGLAAVDYRLTDPFLDPPGEHDGYYAEESLRLPHSFWCFDPIDLRPEATEKPAARGAGIAWGCLNNPNKINGTTLDMWGPVLRATPASTLRVLTVNPADARRIAAHLARFEVDPARLVFVPKQPRGEYLKTYNRCDIVLDTFPYNGHTTSCDALWMGVPVVSRAGESAISRAGLSLLSNLRLGELVARDANEFVAVARALAADRARLLRLQTTLRATMEASPLMDGARFARDIEAAFRVMWRRWCDSPTA